MSWFWKLFGIGSPPEDTHVSSVPIMREPHPQRVMSQQQFEASYKQMVDAIDRETPEQRQRFHLEVAALMGNESAAKLLAQMGPDPEKEKPN